MLDVAPFASCFVDAPVDLAADVVNRSAWRLTWDSAGPDADTTRVDIAVDAQPLLPSGRLATPISTLAPRPGASEVIFRVPQGAPPPFYFTVASTGCGRGQTVVSDVYAFGGE